MEVFLFLFHKRLDAAGRTDSPGRRLTWGWVALSAAAAGLLAAMFLVADRPASRPEPADFGTGRGGQSLAPAGGTGRASDDAPGPDVSDPPAPVPTGQAPGRKGSAAERAGMPEPARMTVLARTDAAEAGTDESGEQAIRRRFGVVRRDGTWIPVTGEGTNRVYITTGFLPPGRVGIAYEAQVEAVSGQQPYRWAVIGGALPPAWMLNGTSGIVRGLSTDPVSAPLFLEVTDARGAKDVAGYVLTVLPTQDLAIVTASLPAAMPGAEYAVQIQAAGGVPPYRWNLEGGAALGGLLELDPLSGWLQGVIADSAPTGDVPLCVTVTDAQVQVSKTLVLRRGARLAIVDVPSDPVYAGESFQFEFRAAGGLEPVVWGLAGNLPPGLTFTAAGRWMGSPSAAGSYAVSVWAQDADGWTAAEPFVLEVLPERPAAVSDFEALASRSRVALRWTLPPERPDLAVRIERGDGVTVYAGPASSCLDGPLAAGRYAYTAFLVAGGVPVTSAPPPSLSLSVPPDGDPFADRIAAVRVLHTNAFGADRLPAVVLGPPSGTGLASGSRDVLSLGAASNDDAGATAPYGGMIVLEFTNNAAWNGPGADFTVFENVFYLYNDAGEPDPDTRFMEPAVVSVSQDGLTWRAFPTDFSPRYQPGGASLNLRHPYCYRAGFAGINPVLSCGNYPDPTAPEVSGGDSFDLADVGLEWIRYVALQSTGHRWLRDAQGDLIHHIEDTGAASRSSPTAGFDLDAVTAIWFHKVSAAGDAAANARAECLPSGPY